MGGHIDSAEVSRVEVIEAGRRRRWTEEEKLRIVSESLSGPRLVSLTARRYGISRWLLSTWRRQFRVQVRSIAEAKPELVPAVVVPEASASPLAKASHPKAPPKLASSWVSGRMEIVASNGRRLIIDAGVDLIALERVLDVLERR
jgi:transposase